MRVNWSAFLAAFRRNSPTFLPAHTHTHTHTHTTQKRTLILAYRSWSSRAATARIDTVPTFRLFFGYYSAEN